jgi:flagellar biosynthesis chaperone FliJ
MLLSLNGTADAAGKGDKAFVEYVTALATKTNTNMGLLVKALQTNIASGNSDLKNMLNQNGIFAQGVLDDLNKQAAALGQGAVDGGNGLLNSLFASRSQSQAAAAQQAAVFNGIGSSTGQMQNLTNDQLVQLLTVFLAQSAVQDSEFAKANEATMGAVGSLSDAMDISLNTMDAISNMTQDALNLSSNETSEAEVEVNEATQAVVDFASQAANNITQSSEGYFSNLRTAIDQASSFTSAFRQRLNDDRNTFTSAQPGFDQSLAKLKSDITNLGVTVNTNRQAAIDRVNDWAIKMEQDALSQLSGMQQPATSTR